jgi:hypothetical protein
MDAANLSAFTVVSFSDLNVYIITTEQIHVHLPPSPWMALQPLWALTSFLFPDLFTISRRTSWTSDQRVARPLVPKHRTAQTQNKHIYTPNINALSGIQTHDHCLRDSEDSSCRKSFSYRDRQVYLHVYTTTMQICIWTYLHTVQMSVWTCIL